MCSCQRFYGAPYQTSSWKATLPFAPCRAVSHQCTRTTLHNTNANSRSNYYYYCYYCYYYYYCCYYCYYYYCYCYYYYYYYYYYWVQDR